MAPKKPILLVKHLVDEPGPWLTGESHNETKGELVVYHSYILREPPCVSFRNYFCDISLPCCD